MKVQSLEAHDSDRHSELSATLVGCKTCTNRHGFPSFVSSPVPEIRVESDPNETVEDKIFQTRYCLILGKGWVVQEHALETVWMSLDGVDQVRMIKFVVDGLNNESS